MAIAQAAGLLSDVGQICGRTNLKYRDHPATNYVENKRDPGGPHMRPDSALALVVAST